MALVESFSGIRGIYGSELTEDLAKKYAHAFSDFLHEKTGKKDLVIVIGRDSRNSGPALLKVFLDYLDADVINVGVLPTPFVQNAVRDFNADAGVIITASHNPPEYNGFKLLDSSGACLKAEDISEVINLVRNKDFSDRMFREDRNIYYSKEKAVEHYVQFVDRIIKDLKVSPDLKVVVDPNGGAGTINRHILEKYSLNAVYINMEQGEFKREIEPHLNSLSYLKDKLIEFDAEFAVGFDCDADRVEILLKNGQLVSGNHLLAIIVDYILENLENLENLEQPTVVVNEATSHVVREIALKHNANHEESEVGESKVVEQMINSNSPIGGEGSSGGVIIPPSKCRDGTLTLLYLLKIMSEKNLSIDNLLNNLPNYHYIKDVAELNDEFLPLKLKLKEHYEKKGFQVRESGSENENLKLINPLDSSWVLIRPSKTESGQIRIIADSRDKSVSEGLIEEVKRILFGLC